MELAKCRVGTVLEIESGMDDIVVATTLREIYYPSIPGSVGDAFYRESLGYHSATLRCKIRAGQDGLFGAEIIRDTYLSDFELTDKRLIFGYYYVRAILGCQSVIS